MVLVLLIVLGLSLVCAIIGGIIGIIGEVKNGNASHVSNDPSDSDDNHWESSFDWKDENNDGYDDRNDGFWNEREF